MAHKLTFLKALISDGIILDKDGPDIDKEWPRDVKSMCKRACSMIRLDLARYLSPLNPKTHISPFPCGWAPIRHHEEADTVLSERHLTLVRL